MKRLLFFLLFSISSDIVFAAAGDTLVVQAFTFNSTRDSVIQFPSDTMRFEKILMLYTLKCTAAPGVGNPPYPCGEWDYLTYTYLYKPTGTFDSTVTRVDTLSTSPLVVDTVWNVFEVNERFELGRFITPYGIGLNLDNQGIDGGNGFTWVFDVSDYATLLRGAKRLTAGNWQELLDLRFLFIEGTPPRDVIKIENLWNGSFGLSTINQTVVPKNIQLDPNASMYKMKTRSSGHGQGNANNCGEFCQKNLSVKTDGVTRYSWLLWTKCADNAVFPQGGTWIFERAGWCPGAIVPDYDHELTPFVTPGSQVLLDYDSETDPDGNQVLEVQLISYSAPNFSYDAAVEDIVSPNIADIHSRRNPICANPVIIIKNTGSHDMTSALITYGVEGGSPCYYLWQGNLKFLETEEVALPDLNWTGVDPANPVFYASIDYPNNHYDQYQFNNTAKSRFVIPPVLASTFVVWAKPDNYYQEFHWDIKDANGTIMAQNAPYSSSTLHKDTVQLADGCYTFSVTDDGEDGLGFWYYNVLDNQYSGTPGYTPYNVGTGLLGLRKYTGASYWKLFDVDYGVGLSYSFTVGHTLGGDSSAYQCTPISITPIIDNVSSPKMQDDFIQIYPNPTAGKITVELNEPLLHHAEIKILNVLGKIIYAEVTQNFSSGKVVLDLNSLPSGVYIFWLKSSGNVSTKEFVISNN